MKVLVTGGSGFIGRNIISECNKRGWETVSFDIAPKNSDANFHITESVMNLAHLKKAMNDVDYVFHLAAVT
ncbi:MAG: NAD-dependent epimerase/dehydratase family protein, partial [Thermoplasmatales archaeon]